MHTFHNPPDDGSDFVCASLDFDGGPQHPLARALTAIHEQPGADWSLATMAGMAGMSRSTFALAFKQQVGHTPADYLTQWRVAIAQSLLRNGASVKTASAQLGYGSASSLSRAFTQTVGASPRAWLHAQA